MTFKVANVNFQLSGRQILKGINLELETGLFYGLLGPNGSGKTTLLDLLLGHKQPSAGNIYLQGKKINQYKRSDLARKIALVPQSFSLNFAYTVHQVIIMGRYPHLGRFTPPGKKDLALVEKIMHQTQTWQLRDRFVTDLSGGERQRVIFARALAQETDILLLDEATSNLDIKHSLSLLTLCTQLCREKKTTIIAVFQDINLAAMFCNSFLLLKEGCLMAQGKAHQVLTPEAIAQVFEVQSKVSYDPDLSYPQVQFQRQVPGAKLPCL